LQKILGSFGSLQIRSTSAACSTETQQDLLAVCRHPVLVVTVAFPVQERVEGPVEPLDQVYTATVGLGVDTEEVVEIPAMHWRLRNQALEELHTVTSQTHPLKWDRVVDPDQIMWIVNRLAVAVELGAEVFN
jgi:hypothetical protein